MAGEIILPGSPIVQPSHDPQAREIDWGVIWGMAESQITALARNGAARTRMRVRLGRQLLNAAFAWPTTTRRATTGLSLSLTEAEIRPGVQVGRYFQLPLFLFPGADLTRINVQAIATGLDLAHGAEVE